MALTSDILKANSILKDLTDEQVAAIVAVSANDENTVIGKKIGDIYGGLDNDILTASGIEKNGTEKTYDYLKRVIGDMKVKSEGFSAKVSELEAENTRLEGVIAQGGVDSETKHQLEQAKADLVSVTKDYADLKAEFDKSKDAHAAELFGLKVEGELSSAVSDIKFRKDLPKSVTDILLRQAVDKVKGMKPEYVDDGNGGRVLVFKGENDEILRNKENQLNPYNASELITRELDALGVIDKGRKQEGTGIEPNPKGGSSSVSADVSSARTQNEAHEIIAKELMKKGLVNGSAEFQEEMDKAWKDNKVSELPIR